MFWNHTEVLRLLNGKDTHTITHQRGTVFVRGDNEDLILTYHGSKLVTYHQNNSFTLSGCGFRTKTTKARLTEYGPAKIYAGNGTWMIDSDEGPRTFHDGMRTDPYGNPVDPEDWAELNPPDDLDPREETRDNQIFKTFL